MFDASVSLNGETDPTGSEVDYVHDGVNCTLFIIMFEKEKVKRNESRMARPPHRFPHLAFSAGERTD